MACVPARMLVDEPPMGSPPVSSRFSTSPPARSVGRVRKNSHRHSTMFLPRQTPPDPASCEIRLARQHMMRRKSVTLSNRCDLNNSGTGPSATPGPRGAEMANDYRLNGRLLCRGSVRLTRYDGTTSSHLRQFKRARTATQYLTENRPPGRGGMRSYLDGDAGLEQEFAAAAAGVAAEYQRRLSGLRGLSRHKRAGAARAIKEWHVAALSALRRDHEAKRAAARQRRAARARLCRPAPSPRRPRQSYPQRRPS